MSGVTVQATINVDPERAEEAIAALSEAIAASHDEEGCVVYALHTVKDDPSTLIMLEHWETEDQLENHRHQPHLATLRTKLPATLTGPSEVKYLTAIPIGQPAKATIG
jgi:quinol monooxygenase YgiN